MRRVIYGAGSLRTMQGTYITKNGGEIDLVDRNRAHMEELETTGVHIIGTLDMTVPVNAITSDQITGKYDIILLLTKRQNVEVVTMFRDYLAEDGVIVTLENGPP